MGTGILYLNKSKIKKLWPKYADYDFGLNQIEKLNHTGTHLVAADIAINYSIDYHEWIGIEKKELLLRFLQNYWTEKVRGKEGIYLNTPSNPKLSAAICNVGIEGLNPSDLAKILLNKYKIWTVVIDRSNIKGVSVTPNLYTTTQELDELVNALLKISKAR